MTFCHNVNKTQRLCVRDRCITADSLTWLATPACKGKIARINLEAWRGRRKVGKEWWKINHQAVNAEQTDIQTDSYADSEREGWTDGQTDTKTDRKITDAACL